MKWEVKRGRDWEREIRFFIWPLGITQSGTKSITIRYNVP